MRDPYTVLGVSKDTSPADLKKTYRKLAMKYHPDQNPGDEKMSEKFKEVSAAYALLSDEKMRARYDRGEINPDGSEKGFAGYRQNAHAGGNPFGGASGFSGFGAGFDAEDLFSSLFGGGRTRTHRAKPSARGEDKTYNINIDFLDAVLGSKKQVRLENGKTLNINTPVNVREGQQIRLKGQGGAGIGGGPNGDALIEVHINKHPYYTLKGNDIHMELPITLEEAVCGGKVTVPTISGKIALTIPKNSSSGKLMRLKGRGAEDPKTMKKGDQFVKLMVTLPAEADSELEKFIKKWSAKNDDSKNIREHLG
ncbi:MAG: J domain-containing protein [Alphaproteobacteria bacterium]|nr:J domain-containing protein [Alphaproteobacteria bacterium]HPF45427.1 J domain-containing protein [Emcibacteraceae bacterium]